MLTNIDRLLVHCNYVNKVSNIVVTIDCVYAFISPWLGFVCRSSERLHVACSNSFMVQILARFSARLSLSQTPGYFPLPRKSFSGCFHLMSCFSCGYPLSCHPLDTVDNMFSYCKQSAWWQFFPPSHLMPSSVWFLFDEKSITKPSFVLPVNMWAHCLASSWALLTLFRFVLCKTMKSLVMLKFHLFCKAMD